MPEPIEPNEQPDIKALREQASRAGSLESENQSKDREIGFLKAGVDTGTLLGRNIMEAHGDKELTAEAIAETTAAVRESLGLPDPEAKNENDPDPDAAANAANDAARAALHGGEAPPGTPTPQPDKSLIDTAVDTYIGARKAGMGEIEAQEAGIGEIIRAGANGHPQAAYDDEKFRALAREHGHGAEFAGLPERDYTPNIHHTKDHALQR